MKKGWKIFLITCLSLVAVGIVGTIIGFALGASTGELGNHIKDSGLYGFSRDLADADESLGDTFESQGERREIGRVNTIDVSNEFGVIEIVASPDDKVYVEEGQGRGSFEVEQEDGELEISSEAYLLNRFFSHRGKWIRLYLPPDTRFSEVSLDVGAGRLQADHINASQLALNVDAGEGIIRDFTADSLDIECGAGKVEVAGDVKNEADIDCSVGETVTTLNAAQEDFNYSLNCGVGEIKLGDTSYSGIGHDQDINNNARKNISIDCGVGRVEVNFRQ